MKIVFFDVETLTTSEINKKLYQGFRMLTANMCNYNPKYGLNIVDTLQTKDKSDFFYWIETNIQPKQIMYVLSANIWFDLRNSGLFKHLIRRRWEPKIFHSKGMTIIIKMVYKNFTIVFLNMQQLIPVGVKAYGEMVDLAKLDVDPSNPDDGLVMEYCQRDTDIITKVFEQWLAFVHDNDLGKFSYTLAGQAFTSFRYRFMKNKIYIHRIKWLTDFERECYYGGRVEIFHQGKIPEPIIYAVDVNSMYPFMMKNCHMPVKFFKIVKQPGTVELNYCLKQYICLAWVALDTNEPAYPKVVNKRLCFPTGRFITFLSHPEIEYANNHNHIYSIEYLILYKHADIFSDYVKFFHARKNEYTQNGNKAYRFMTKRLMNSLYGKFGQRVDIPYFEDELKEEKYSMEKVYDPETDTAYTELCLGYTRKVFREAAGDASESLVAIPTHITGSARMYLWKLIKTARRENVYYCDTDSLFVNKNGYKNLTGKYIGDSLGQLSLEKTAGNVVLYGAKDYIFGEKAKIKGIKQGTEPNTEGGYAHLQFPGFRSDLRAGLDKPYAIRQVTKFLKREYEKGVVDDNGKVTPFHLGEF